MTDYSKGKIYKIISDDCEQCYVGSTVQKLSSRMSSHRRDYRNFLRDGKIYCSSAEILKFPDCRIILIENFPCESKEQLNAREEQYRVELGACNKKCCHTGIEYGLEKNEYGRQYSRRHYAANREEILKKQAEKIACVCGSVVTKYQLARHRRTNIHQRFIEMENKNLIVSIRRLFAD